MGVRVFRGLEWYKTLSTNQTRGHDLRNRVGINNNNIDPEHDCYS